MDPWLIAAPAVGFAGLTAYGAVHPRAQILGPTVCHSNRPEKLALTFDDGPNPALTPKLLDLLDRYEPPGRSLAGSDPLSATAALGLDKLFTIWV